MMQHANQDVKKPGEKLKESSPSDTICQLENLRSSSFQEQQPNFKRAATELR
jgi:hypothetical protein